MTMNYTLLDFSDRAMLNRLLHESSDLKQLGILTYALCKRPDDLFLHSQIGRVYYSLGLLGKAEKHLNIATHDNNDYPVAIYHKALICQQHNDLESCVELMQSSAALSGNADYQLNLISVLMLSNRYEDAIEQCLKGIEAHPIDERFPRARVNAHRAAGQLDLALNCCDDYDTTGKDPEWPLLRYKIYTSLNNPARAAIEHNEHTRRLLLGQSNYRHDAMQVLSSVTDVNLRNELSQLWMKKLNSLPTLPIVDVSSSAIPRVAMSILVRDEADIIAENIRYHAAHGVEQFIVTDNASVDGTREILEQLQTEFNLEIIDEPSHTIDQDLWVTRMAQQLSKHSQCDWVIHNDADEFWVPHNGSIPQSIQTSLKAQGKLGVLACKRLNMLADKQQVASPDYTFYENCFATVKTVPLLGGEQPWQGNTSNCVARTVMDKVLTRIDGMGDIEYGNHGAEHDLPKGNCSTITILHYPVRTYQQFERKVVNYGESLAQNSRFKEGSSVHLRYWYQRYLDGMLEDDYATITFDQARLQALLDDGYLKDETRVRSYFESQLNYKALKSA